LAAAHVLSQTTDIGVATADDNDATAMASCDLRRPFSATRRWIISKSEADADADADTLGRRI